MIVAGLVSFGHDKGRQVRSNLNKQAVRLHVREQIMHIRAVEKGAAVHAADDDLGAVIVFEAREADTLRCVLEVVCTFLTLLLDFMLFLLQELCTKQVLAGALEPLISLFERVDGFVTVARRPFELDICGVSFRRDCVLLLLDEIIYVRLLLRAIHHLQHANVFVVLPDLVVEGFQ